MTRPDPEAIRSAIATLVTARGPDKSVCPSEVARLLDPEDWRPLMQPVRDAAAELARSGHLRITQRARDVEPREARGAIRLSAPGRGKGDADSDADG